MAGGILPQFDFGSLVRITALFLNSAATAINPTAVYFKYEAFALGVVTTYTLGVGTGITQATTGTYYVDIDSNESSGKYRWRFWSTGTGQASVIDEFYVSPQGF